MRRGVRDLLTDAGIEVVGEAGTVEEALRRIPAVHPDVAVLDVRLPDGNGVEVCRDIRADHPEIACLMLTSYTDDEALLDAVMAGAAGYVLKQIRGDDLVERHPEAGRRPEPARSRRPRPAAWSACVPSRRRSQDRGAHAQERSLLLLLAEGLTNREIAARMYLAEKTVKNYVSNLLTKMGMNRRTEAAVYAGRLPGRNGDRRRAD